MEAGGNEISRLSEEVLASILSRTSPPDAGRCAAVSRAFLAAADSDVVWSCFLPRDLPRLAEGVLPHAPLSKKGLFRCLSDQPALLPGNLSMWLDKKTGAMCYMLSARSKHISWGETIDYWERIKLGSDEIQANNSFCEAAQLRGVWWLLIRGEIHSTMLSPNSKYAAYMVFKLADEFFNLDFPFQEASTSVGGIDDSTRQVCLQAYIEDGDAEDVMLPRKRADGWMEVELGEFYNGEGCDSEVSVCLKETEGGVWKTGLIVWGIEIRTKK
ncbi:F-box protein PP2-B11-like [Triticum dicoccoides]|uniref:F-box protein PP2-B11-like n=1 Tax=Triticum dicoccoides TaxID=85692 RepID=UPI001890CAC2|nr:F-box protein PP2-B11-like [Triticum dicoccoides]